jgi:hypothetical protein
LEEDEPLDWMQALGPPPPPTIERRPLEKARELLQTCSAVWP